MYTENTLIHWPIWKNQRIPFKGTLTREILPLVFFIRTRPLTPRFIPQSRFEYKFEFAKIFQFIVDPLVWPPPPRGIGFFLQARADLKPEYYSSCIVLLRHIQILHRLSFKSSSRFSKNILTIPRCGCRSHGRGNSGKFDPPGGATS